MLNDLDQRERQRIAAEPGTWAAIVADPEFTSTFSLHGESLKRAPRGFPKDHPQVEALKLKSHIAMSDLALEDVVGDGLVDLLIARFGLAADYTRFLCEALGQPY